MPAAAIAGAPARSLSERPIVLRRIENKRATRLANRASSAMTNRGVARGVMRTNVDQTFGAGTKAPGPMSKQRSISAQAASITVNRP
jgi:hypothetical protein